jgi:hypothetical protein
MENLLIYGSIFDMLDELSNEEAGLLFKALNSFRKGKEVEFEDRYLKGLWKGIKPNLDKLKENYDSKVKANQENGKKGGRPKKSNDVGEPSKTSTKNKALETIISSQIIQDDQVEMKVSEIEDNAANGSTEIKLQELRLIDIKELSDFKSKYNCFIPKVLLEYMYLIEGKLGLENKLKKIYQQTDFNLELLDILKEQHNREILV